MCQLYRYKRPLYVTNLNMFFYNKKQKIISPMSQNYPHKEVRKKE